jgi:hypothetical protein
MTDEFLAKTLSEIRANATEDEVPLTYVHQEGLASPSKVQLGDSSNLRLLRISVTELNNGRMTPRRYERNVDQIMAMAEKSWRSLQSISDPSSLLTAAKSHFEDLYDACNLMLDDPIAGLRGATLAFSKLDQLEDLVARTLREENNTQHVA